MCFIVRFKVFFASMFLLLIMFSGRGQNLIFRQLTVENGLSQNAVMSVAQDKQGFMWYGTRYGLNRYDGIRFKVYKSQPGDSTTLSDNIVNALLIDSEGTLWIGTLSGLCRYNNETDAFERIRLTPDANPYVACLYEDAQRQLWIGTNYGLLKLVNKKTNQFEQAFPGITLLHTKGNMIRCIYKAGNGKLWAGTSTALISIEPNNKFQVYHHDPKQPGSISADFITSIAEDNQGRLWVGTQFDGLNIKNNDGSFMVYKQPGGTGMNNNIRTILPVKGGNLWIGTQDGLSIIDPQTLTSNSYRHDPGKSSSLSNNSVHTLYQDKYGTVWIGTYHGGINFAYSYTTPFNIYQNNNLSSSISNNVISSVTEDEQQNLWIGTEGGGLNYFNRQTGDFYSYKNSPGEPGSISSNLVKVVYKDREGRLWIGTSYGNGLNLYHAATKKFQRIVLNKQVKEYGNFDEILALQQTYDGVLWVGAQSGLTILRPDNTGQFPNRTSSCTLNNRLPNKNIHALFEDSRRNLWIGTSAGLFVFNPATNHLELFFKKEGNKDSLQSDAINCITEDSKGNIWIGTFYGGVSKFDYSSGLFVTYTDKQGMPNNNVLGIVEDTEGMLWLSTDNGLARLHPEEHTFKIYTISDGLAGNKFSNNSFFKDSKNQLYFGGNNGLTVFNPVSLQTNTFTAPIQFTSLELFGNTVGIHDKTGLLQKNISYTTGLNFKYDQSNFTINWAMLNFIKPEKNKYAYLLEGFEKQWNYTYNASVTYSNLPAGHYTLLVKAANNDGIWTSEPSRLNITVRPPIWKTWYAYIFYAAVIITIIFFVLRFLWLRTLFKKEHELHQFKLNFFTNISHEIRTHLTLISGPVEKLLQIKTDDKPHHRQLEQVKRNSDRLTQLVDELMIFRKAETNNLPLHFVKANIVAFTKTIYNSFADIATARNIQTSFEVSSPVTEIYFDEGQMTKVIFNLLTNAFKFTQDGGRVNLTIEENKQDVLIHVSDNGKGIAPENIKRLFVNFFQVSDDTLNTGYGIGLALSKSIVELHKGRLTVSSRQPSAGTEGKTTFTISLQKSNEHLRNADINVPKTVSNIIPLQPATLINHVAEPLTEDENKPVILLVEDNAELRSFISESLTDSFTVLESVNGLEGWKAAVDQMPELIISDVMMPGKNGFDLCQELKQDIRTSHIPVILLTAKAGQENQITGLTCGADAYISKPFSMQVLQLQAKNLVAGREAMRLKFSRQLTGIADISQQVTTWEEPPVQLNAADQDFMNRLLGFIDEYIDEPAFNVSLLSTKMLVSSPILYKKLKALTGMTVNDFVKSLRLKKAAILLREGGMNVSEVAYAVGFNRRKYFSEEFKKVYGINPSEFAGQESDS
jgi:ligand-binding sensor domain-containing protein/signal transduction histidine kinase/DNA-binding response OmpR family regulator